MRPAVKRNRRAPVAWRAMIPHRLVPLALALPLLAGCAEEQKSPPATTEQPATVLFHYYTIGPN